MFGKKKQKNTLTFTPGWQQPANRPTLPCPHPGLIGAKFAVARHAVGHQWICTCGEVFEVHPTYGGRKLIDTKVDLDG